MTSVLMANPSLLEGHILQRLIGKCTVTLMAGPRSPVWAGQIQDVLVRCSAAVRMEALV